MLATHRRQHWACLLEAYNFTLEHRRSHLLTHVDALSRLPDPDVNIPAALVNFVEDASDGFPKLPLTAEVIALESAKDPILSKVIQYVACEWPPKIEEPMKVFSGHRQYLSISHKCLMFGARVVIPECFQSRVLSLLHAGHPGVIRTKLLARESVWWPSLTKDIEALCAGCEACKVVNFTPSKSETLPWPSAKAPFERVHLDFFQFDQQTFLILCDSFSKWIQVEVMETTTASKVNVVLLKCLRCGVCFPVWYVIMVLPFSPRSF